MTSKAKDIVMKRNILLASGAAVVLASSSAVALGSAGAAAHLHTLKLHAKQLQTKELGKAHEVEADVLRSGGHRVGYSTESCFFGGQGEKCIVTITLKNGVMYGHYTFPITDGSTPTVARGKVKGGLGAYDGVKGKIKVRATSRMETLTIRYG
ncbi:MAG: hypothetical protein JO246_11170 [Frankiaceae bacterium]|nr:hypothetical protein [Frankiaceae bacterium]MBV9871091.1 hypothetical protein [Frankiaceae bacterium]